MAVKAFQFNCIDRVSQDLIEALPLVLTNFLEGPSPQIMLGSIANLIRLLCLAGSTPEYARNIAANIKYYLFSDHCKKHPVLPQIRKNVFRSL